MEGTCGSHTGNLRETPARGIEHLRGRKKIRAAKKTSRGGGDTSCHQHLPVGKQRGGVSVASCGHVPGESEVPADGIEKLRSGQGFSGSICAARDQNFAAGQERGHMPLTTRAHGTYRPEARGHYSHGGYRSLVRIRHAGSDNVESTERAGSRVGAGIVDGAAWRPFLHTPGHCNDGRTCCGRSCEGPGPEYFQSVGLRRNDHRNGRYGDSCRRILCTVGLAGGDTVEGPLGGGSRVDAVGGDCAPRSAFLYAPDHSCVNRPAY